MKKGKITEALGDGAAATERFIKEEIVARFGNPILNPLEDGSLVGIPESHIIVSTDSFIVDPPFYPQSNIGELAISGTVNDILATGGIPRYITMSLILSDDLDWTALHTVLDFMRTTAKKAGVELIAGDTKTIRLSRSTSFILVNTTGLGVPIISPKYTFPVSNALPDDLIIVTGEVGNHGLAVLSAREGLGFEHRVVSDTQPLNDLLVPLIRQFYPYIHCLRDPSRGGLAGVLVDISTASNVDIVIHYDHIPIQEEVAIGCSMLGMDPIDLVNEGKMVIVASPEGADAILNFLQSHTDGEKSAVIGRVTHPVAPRTGQVILQKENQKKRIIKPEKSGIPRLC